MGNSSVAKLRSPVGIVAAVAVSISALFAGTAVSVADPYDDDGGGSSSSGSADESGGVPEAPVGGGIEEPAGGGMPEPPAAGEPAGGGMQEEPPGVHEAPGGGMQEEPPGGGVPEAPGGGEPSGGVPEAPAGGDTHEDPSAGGGLAEPTGAEAATEDVATATSSEVVSTSSSEVSSEELTSYEESVSSVVSSSSLTTELALSSPVTQWNSSWISYDQYYRPVFTNPYRTPLSIVYDYGGQTQVFTVPPLGRAAMTVPNAGVYSFTAMTRPESGPATNLSVGSFSGGGYQPAPGQAPPQKPARLDTKKNVLVQVKFDRGTSDPFRVKSLTDLGPDPAVNGAIKVLLDEEVPAWGQWSKTPQGEALFVINETQLLPGIKRPSQQPLPGYNVKLAAETQSTSWIADNKTVIIVAVGVLVLGAVGFLLVSRRRPDAE
ncbi:hypothetical protein BayCH28_06195 [Mycolicibacterium sp. CH28]|uniref:hypothetical protein n=1 Tax=Mycolicibacterium sp. CH28 TaxID=2512237 RepID=UPI001081A020|nr:hypothetical protein [Mycolicibacterium sp. CH28]TGD88971.1 hypothetical protein BayCH28_06195 [Mycolicibacterium sp. CH28]